jgi:hypothetical protein
VSDELQQAKDRLRIALAAVLETAKLGRDPDTGEDFYWIPIEAVEGLRVAAARYGKAGGTPVLGIETTEGAMSLREFVDHGAHVCPDGETRVGTYDDCPHCGNDAP